MGQIKEPSEEDPISYMTQRSLYKHGDPRKKNWGSTPHKCTVWVLKSDPNTANVIYKCPNCDHEDQKQTPYSEPFAFECDGCGKTIKVPKLDKRLGKKKKKKKKTKK